MADTEKPNRIALELPRPAEAGLFPWVSWSSMTPASDSGEQDGPTAGHQRPRQRLGRPRRGCMGPPAPRRPPPGRPRGLTRFLLAEAGVGARQQGEGRGARPGWLAGGEGERESRGGASAGSRGQIGAELRAVPGGMRIALLPPPAPRRLAELQDLGNKRARCSFLLSLRAFSFFFSFSSPLPSFSQVYLTGAGVFLSDALTAAPGHSAAAAGAGWRGARPGRRVLPWRRCGAAVTAARRGEAAPAGSNRTGR